MTDTHDELYKRALETRLRAEDEKKGLKHTELDELGELEDFLRKIASIDLGKLAEERLNKLGERDRIAHDLMKGGTVDRRLKKMQQPKRKRRMHWKTAEKKRKDYYKKVAAPRLRERKAMILKDKGWFPLLAEQWKRAKLVVELTEEEWNREVASHLGDWTPMIHRYDATGPISLENIWITAGRTTVFDGAEYKLRSSGYIL